MGIFCKSNPLKVIKPQSVETCCNYSLEGKRGITEALVQEYRRIMHLTPPKQS